MSPYRAPPPAPEPFRPWAPLYAPPMRPGAVYHAILSSPPVRHERWRGLSVIFGRCPGCNAPEAAAKCCHGCPPAWRMLFGLPPRAVGY